jgi:mannonate dehydratase
MKLGIRWYGSTEDNVPLKYIRQIPNVKEIWGSLYDVPVGDVWPIEKILAMRDEVNRAGFEMHVIESVNVHEEIKLGGPDRNLYIENYTRVRQSGPHPPGAYPQHEDNRPASVL